MIKALISIIIALIIMVFVFMLLQDKPSPNIYDKQQQTNKNINEETVYINDIRIPLMPIAKQNTELRMKNTPGWEIWGMVSDNNGTPIVGSEISFQIEYNYLNIIKIIGTTITNDNGYYKMIFNVPGSITEEKYKASIFYNLKSVARKHGYISENKLVDNIYYPGIDSDALKLDFVLNKNNRIYGKVYSEEGLPVYDAKIILDNDKLIATTDIDGGYEFNISHSAEYKINALKIGNGISKNQNIFIDSSVSLEVPDLVLGKYGEIEGIVVDPDGRPVCGLCVDMIPENYKDSSFNDIVSHISRAFQSAKTIGDGNVGIDHGYDITDCNGRFKIGGLKEGLYFRFFRQLFNTNEYIESVGEYVYSTGMANVKLTVKLHRLRVHIKNNRDEIVHKSTLKVDDASIMPKLYNVINGFQEVYVTPGKISLLASTESGLIGENEVDVSQTEYVKEINLRLINDIKNGKLVIKLSDDYGKVGMKSIKLKLIGSSGPMSIKEIDCNVDSGLEDNIVLTTYPDNYILIIDTNDYDNYYIRSIKSGVSVEENSTTKVTMHMKKGGMFNVILENSAYLNSKIEIIIWHKDDTGKQEYRNAVNKLYDNSMSKYIDTNEIVDNKKYTINKVFEPGIYKVYVYVNENKVLVKELIVSEGQETTIHI